MKRFQNGPARLDNGWEARIYALDGGDGFPIHGAYRIAGDDEWIAMVWRENGRRIDISESPLDILPNAAPVVSDAALDAFYAATCKVSRVASPRDEIDEKNAAGLAAAFAVMLAEQGE